MTNNLTISGIKLAKMLQMDLPINMYVKEFTYYKYPIKFNDNASIMGNFYFGENVQIGNHVKIIGRCFLKKAA